MRKLKILVIIVLTAAIVSGCNVTVGRFHHLPHYYHYPHHHHHHWSP